MNVLSEFEGVGWTTSTTVPGLCPQVARLEAVSCSDLQQFTVRHLNLLPYNAMVCPNSSVPLTNSKATAMWTRGLASEGRCECRPLRMSHGQDETGQSNSQPAMTKHVHAPFTLLLSQPSDISRLGHFRSVRCSDLTRHTYLNPSTGRFSFYYLLP